MRLRKILIGCLLLSMTACSPKSNELHEGNEVELNASETTETSSSDTHKDYKRVISEQLIFNIPDFELYHTSQEKIRVKNKEFEVEKIKSVFFPEDESTYQLESPYDGITQLITEQGLNIVYDGSSITGSTKAWDDYNEFLGYRDIIEMPVESPRDLELEFQTKNETQKKVQELMESINLEFAYHNIKIEGYNHEYLNELSDVLKNELYYSELKGEMKDKVWLSADDIYCIEVTFSENGIPIEAEGYALFDESYVVGMKLQLYLTNQGVQSINIIQPLTKEKQDVINICDIEQGIEAIVSKYSNIITDEKMEIIGAELEYNILPSEVSGEVYLSPVLRFDTKSTTTLRSSESDEVQNIDFYGVIRVNAESGKIIE